MMQGLLIGGTSVDVWAASPLLSLGQDTVSNPGFAGAGRLLNML